MNGCALMLFVMVCVMVVRQRLQLALSMILSKGLAACRMPLWMPGCNAAAAVNTIHVIAEFHGLV